MSMKAEFTFIDGELVSMTRGGVSHDVVTDPAGNVVALLDSGGNITDTFEYWPFGELRARSGTTEIPFQFAARSPAYKDSASRIHFSDFDFDVQRANPLQTEPRGNGSLIQHIVAGTPFGDKRAAPLGAAGAPLGIPVLEQSDQTASCYAQYGQRRKQNDCRKYGPPNGPCQACITACGKYNNIPIDQDPRKNDELREFCKDCCAELQSTSRGRDYNVCLKKCTSTGFPDIPKGKSCK